MSSHIHKQPDSLHPLFPSVPFKGSYGVKEAARGTGIPRRTLYRAIEQGAITALRTGLKASKKRRGLRIPADQLIAYIESITEDPHA